MSRFPALEQTPQSLYTLRYVHAYIDLLRKRKKRCPSLHAQSQCSMQESLFAAYSGRKSQQSAYTFSQKRQPKSESDRAHTYRSDSVLEGKKCGLIKDRWRGRRALVGNGSFLLSPPRLSLRPLKASPQRAVNIIRVSEALRGWEFD